MYVEAAASLGFKKHDKPKTWNPGISSITHRPAAKEQQYGPGPAKAAQSKKQKNKATGGGASKKTKPNAAIKKRGPLQETQRLNKKTLLKEPAPPLYSGKHLAAKKQHPIPGSLA